MTVIPIQDIFFDDEATVAMGTAFDQACVALRHFTREREVRELIAKRIIEAARNGELDPFRLLSRAIIGFSIDDVSVAIASVGQTAPSPAYATVAHAA